jgi:hypothetical protein
MILYTVEYDVDLGTQIIGIFSSVEIRESFLKKYDISIGKDYCLEEYKLDDFTAHIPNWIVVKVD